MVRFTLLPIARAPATYRANTPFWIGHGTSCLPVDDCLSPRTKFVLYVDGAATHPIVDLEVDHGTPTLKSFISNSRCVESTLGE